MNFKNIYNYVEKVEVSNFEECQNILKDSNFVNEVDKFLEYISFNNYSSKVLLTSFLIKNHHSKIFDNDDNSEGQLIDISNEMIIKFKLVLTNFENNISEFKSIFIKYNSIFLKWKEKDEKNLINELTKIFWELELNLFNLKDKTENVEGAEENKKNIELIRFQQNKILERVKMIGGEKGLEHFGNYVPVFLNEDYLNNLFKQITDNYHKAYWDILREEIENNNFDGVLKILKEIKLLLKNLLPNKIKFHNELDEYLDIDFLSQLINNNVLEPQNIQNLVFYIIDNIRKLQSPADDDDTNTWELEIKKDIEDGYLYKDFLPKFFKRTLDKLIKINKQVDIIKSSEMYENIKNKSI